MPSGYRLEVIVFCQGDLQGIPSWYFVTSKGDGLQDSRNMRFFLTQYRLADTLFSYIGLVNVQALLLMSMSKFAGLSVQYVTLSSATFCSAPTEENPTTTSLLFIN